MKTEIVKNREILNKILTKIENIEKVLNLDSSKDNKNMFQQNPPIQKTTQCPTGAELKKQSEERKLFLASKLNRSQYPEIHKIKNLLPLALFILKAMKTKGVENLTPPEISFILKEVFSITKKPERISVALNQQGSLGYTDRERFFIGKTLAYNYSIADKGEDYLKNKLDGLING